MNKCQSTPLPNMHILILSVLISNLDFSQNNCNTFRCFLRPEELDETRTRSSAYIKKFTIVLPSFDPAAFLRSSFSRSIINRLNSKGLKLQPCQTPFSQGN